MSKTTFKKRQRVIKNFKNFNKNMHKFKKTFANLKLQSFGHFLIKKFFQWYFCFKCTINMQLPD